MATTTSPPLIPRTCHGCQAVVPLAVTDSADAFYLGWICPRCLDADADDFLVDVLAIYATREEAEWDLFLDEYYASHEVADCEPDDEPAVVDPQ